MPRFAMMPSAYGTRSSLTAIARRRHHLSLTTRRRTSAHATGGDVWLIIKRIGDVHGADLSAKTPMAHHHALHIVRSIEAGSIRRLQLCYISSQRPPGQVFVRRGDATVNTRHWSPSRGRRDDDMTAVAASISTPSPRYASFERLNRIRLIDVVADWLRAFTPHNERASGRSTRLFHFAPSTCRRSSTHDGVKDTLMRGL